MVKKDFYEVLGVKKTATPEEIKKAYRKLSKTHHPDKGGDEDLFKEINEAYSCLSDKDSRSLYDKYGHNYNDRGNGFAQDDLNEFLRQQMEGFSFNNANQRQGLAKINLIVSLNDLYVGVNKKLKYKRRVICGSCGGDGVSDPSGKHVCSHCNGSGVIRRTNGHMIIETTCHHCNGVGIFLDENKLCKNCGGEGYVLEENEVSFDIPKGCFGGMYITMPQFGHEFTHNNKRYFGDLVVVINETEDNKFKRRGNDLLCEVEVSIIDSLLGGKIIVGCIDGKDRSFNIKTGSPHGSTTRLNGLGMSILNTDQYGDLYVQIKHKIPTKLNDKEISLLNELKKQENFK